MRLVQLAQETRGTSTAEATVLALCVVLMGVLGFTAFGQGASNAIAGETPSSIAATDGHGMVVSQAAGTLTPEEIALLSSGAAGGGVSVLGRDQSMGNVGAGNNGRFGTGNGADGGRADAGVRRYRTPGEGAGSTGSASEAGNAGGKGGDSTRGGVFGVFSSVLKTGAVGATSIASAVVPARGNGKDGGGLFSRVAGAVGVLSSGAKTALQVGKDLVTSAIESVTGDSSDSRGGTPEALGALASSFSQALVDASKEAVGGGSDFATAESSDRPGIERAAAAAKAKAAAEAEEAAAAAAAEAEARAKAEADAAAAAKAEADLLAFYEAAARMDAEAAAARARDNMSPQDLLTSVIAEVPYTPSSPIDWRIDSFQGHMGAYCHATAAPRYGCAPEAIYIAPRVLAKGHDMALAVVSHEIAHAATLRAYYGNDPAVVAGFNAFADKYTGGNFDTAMEYIADSVCMGWGTCGAFHHYVTPSASMIADAMTLVR